MERALLSEASTSEEKVDCCEIAKLTAESPKRGATCGNLPDSGDRGSSHHSPLIFRMGVKTLRARYAKPKARSTSSLQRSYVDVARGADGSPGG